MNDLQIEFSNDDLDLLKAKLYEILEEKIIKYTRGESSSVKNEVAEELLDSICYVLGISLKNPNERCKKLLTMDLKEEMKSGEKRIENKIEFAKALWQKTCETLPKVENDSMIDTLKSIGNTWDNYDYCLFACDFPADIDYQMSVPIPETLLGIDYVIAYLKELFLENLFLSKYSKEVMEPVLNNYCPDYKGLLINLFEPIFSRALALTILSKSDDKLQLSGEDINEIRLMVLNMNRTLIENCLISASNTLLLKYSIEQNPFIIKYCKDLATRVYLLRDTDGLAGIF